MDSASMSIAKCHIWKCWEQHFDPLNAMVLRVSSIASFVRASLMSCRSRDGTKGMMVGRNRQSVGGHKAKDTARNCDRR